MNPDRNNADNNLLQITRSGGLRYWAVDFDEILAGPRWTIETMGMTKDSVCLIPVFLMMGLSVKGLSSFSPLLERAEALSSETIAQILSVVPRSWDIGPEEEKAITEFLLTRTTLVRHILLAHKARFPNWATTGATAQGPSDPMG